jgi:CheY-like chemotaxis protein
MKRILMVDDEEDIDQILLQKFRKEIQRNEVSFFFARDGQQALDILSAEESIDLVLTDINMPAMNGIELLFKIKLKNPNIDVFMISAYTDACSIDLAKRAGAVGFLTKPIDLKQLQSLIMPAV